MEIQRLAHEERVWAFCSIYSKGEVSPDELAHHHRLSAIALECAAPEDYAQYSRHFSKIVALAHPPNIFSCPTVRAESELAGNLAADFLLRLGYRKFAIATNHETDSERVFVRAVSEELIRAGKDPDVCMISVSATGPEALNQLDSETGLISPFHSLESCMRPCLWTSYDPEPAAQAVVSMLGFLRSGKNGTSPKALVGSQTIDSGHSRQFKDDLIDNISLYIDQNLSSGVGVADIIKNFNTPRRSLERYFRKETGNSILQEIQRRQVMLAKQALAKPALSLTDAAQTSGFGATRMLSLNFKKLTGTTPRKFEKNFSLHL